MQNLKISAKLIISFLIVTALTAAVGAAGVNGLLTADKRNSEMYDQITMPMPYMAKVIESIQQLRLEVRHYALSATSVDNAGTQSTHDRINDLKAALTENLVKFDELVNDPDIQALFDESCTLMGKEFDPHLDRTYEMAKSGNQIGIIEELQSVGPAVDTVVSNFHRCMELMVEDAAESNADNADMTHKLLIGIIVALVVSIIISRTLSFYIAGLISKPLTALSGFLRKAATTGDIIVAPEEERALHSFMSRRDEIGQMMKDCGAFINHVSEMAKDLEIIAGNDLTADIEILSDADIIGKSLNQMVESLNHTFNEIQYSSAQVSSGSTQIADDTQILAKGATEQAAAIQELSCSISEITDKTRENAGIAEKAAKLSDAIKENAEKGSQQMDEMITAVKGINDASHSISKIIKTIDDIAFQPNILALNAAVEAARAGQYGKGFAVVAEEVRNLASKSAEAAKDTGEMIQNSMDKAELGSRIAGETAASLSKIVAGINESSTLIAEIAHASESQSQGISQINIGIDQIAQIIQQTSAAAEESAAASEEMSGQSDLLHRLIAQFNLKESGSPSLSLPSADSSTQKRLAITGNGGGNYE